ncbi:MAG: UDP-2,3-diacylglucosamine diphosphatase LpxI [Pseudomonadota bacterium]
MVSDTDARSHPGGDVPGIDQAATEREGSEQAEVPAVATTASIETNSSAHPRGPLGIIAGGGAMPRLVAEAARADGREVFFVGIKGEAGEEITRYPHDWMAWGQVGRLFSLLKDAGCRDVTIIGTVKRPDLRQVRLDLGAVRSLPIVLSILTGGDDAILTTIVGLFERHGLTVRGAHQVAPGLLAPEGLLAGPAPDARALADIAKAQDVISVLGPHDVGQAAVVARQYVLGVEAAEGTDELLRRCGDLRQWGNSWLQRKRVGVLVKMPKPGQELRIDMPTIGPQTVRLVADAGLAGLAVAANGVLIAERDEVVRSAEAAGVFVLGRAIVPRSDTQGERDGHEDGVAK